MGSPGLSLELGQIRDALIRMEDSIIFALIERSQFALNSVVYESNAIPVPGFDADGRRYSLLEYFLRETEQSHGRIRRYTSPDEHAFFPDDLPKLVLPPIQFPNLLHACAEDININDDVMALYVGELLPRIAGGGGGDGPSDDGNHGSAALSDINVLQAMSKRVHYGKFVAEAKFCGPQRTEYERLIAQKDADAIMRLLTDESVER